MQTHTSAQDVAEYLLWLAAQECESDPDYLTPLKLQKLLYYVQGWALAEWEAPLFHEELQAWQDGPVVPQVYQSYSSYGKRPIEAPKALPTGLSDEERALVRSVWDAYKRFSGWGLRELTHAEAPWRDAYKPDAHGRSDHAIRRDRLKQFFGDRVAESHRRIRSRRDRLAALARANTRRLTGRDAI